MLKCYILSLKWSTGDNLVWWRPNNSGYTSFLDDAGLYTEEEIISNPGYYNNGESALAVPVIFVDGYKKAIVPKDKLSKLKEISAEYIKAQSADI